MDAVRGINARRVLAEVATREVQHGVGQVAVVDAATIFELPHVESQDDGQRVDVREAPLQVFAVTLNAGTEGPEVHAIGADADGAAPPAGAERHDLVEGIDKQRPLRIRDQPFELRSVRREVGVGEPLGQVREREFLESGIGIDGLKARTGRGNRIHVEPR